MAYQNHHSRSFCVRRGVLEGSVLGHVLFSLFINNFPASLPPSVSCSFYADDLAIWSSSPSVPTVVEATQEALFRLERWSDYWCLPFNPSECEAFFFSVDPHQANLQSNLLLLNSLLRFNPTPTFLGVTFYRTLSFFKHPSSKHSSLFLNILPFSRAEGILFHLNSSTHRFLRFPLSNLCSLATLAVFSLVYAATDTAYC